MKQLLTAQAANGSSAAHKHPGGQITIVGEGTWDTSTLTLQISPDGGTTWVSTTTTLTADGFANIEDLCPCSIRLNLSSVGGSTEVNGWIG